MRIATVALCGALSVGLLYCRIQHVNQNVQPATTYSFSADQEAFFSTIPTLSGDGIALGDVTIDVTESGLLSLGNLEARYPDYPFDDLMQTESDAKGVYVTLRATNNTSTALAVPFYSFKLVSGAWRNGLNPVYYEVDNGDIGLAPLVEPGSSISVTLCFDLLPSQFGEALWAKVAERDFELLLSDYPNHCAVALGAPRGER